MFVVLFLLVVVSSSSSLRASSFLSDDDIFALCAVARAQEKMCDGCEIKIRNSFFFYFFFQKKKKRDKFSNLSPLFTNSARGCVFKTHTHKERKNQLSIHIYSHGEKRAHTRVRRRPPSLSLPFSLERRKEGG